MSKIRKLFIGIVGILLLGVSGFTAYYFIVLNTPQKIFERSVNFVATKASSMINKKSLVDTSQGKYSVNAKIDYDDGNTMFSNYDYELEFDIDENSKKIYADIGALKDDNKVISANILADSQNLYANIPELYSKTISLGSTAEFWEMYENINKTPKEDYVYLLTFFKDSFLKSLTKKDYTSQNVTIKVNNKDEKVKKSTLLLTKERQKEIIDNVINDIANDSKAKELLATLMEVEEDKLIDSLKENNSNYEGENFELCIYTKLLTNQLIRINAYDEKKQELFKLDIYDNTYNFYIYSYSSDIWNEDKVTKSTQSIIVKKESKNKYNITFFDESNEIATITVNEYTTTKIDLDYVIKLNPQNKDEVIKGKYTSTTTQKDRNSANIKTYLEINYKDNQFKINIDVTQKNTVNIKNVDTKNVININDLTESDMNQIENNFMNNDLIKDFINEYMNYSTTYGALKNVQEKTNMINPNL